MFKKNLLEIKVALENGGVEYIVVTADQIGKLIGNSNISEFHDVQIIEDKPILVTRTCQCGTKLEVSLKRSENGVKMLCHPCGRFTPVSLKYSDFFI